MGGVAAGLSAASAVKRARPEVEVVVYEKSPHVSYASCGIPYYVSGVVTRLPVALTVEQLRDDRGIDVKTEHEVVEVDVGARRVTVVDLRSGRRFTDNFDALLLATGAAPKVPPVEGVDLDGVHLVRSLASGIALREDITSRRPKNAMVVGGGYVGCEMAESLAGTGASVRLVEFADRLLGTVDDAASQLVAEHLAASGVEVHLNAAVRALLPGDDGRVAAADTTAGRFDADLVILSTGVRPVVDLARGAGVALGRTGGIAVNHHQQTNFPNVYAAGDCCEAFHLVTRTWEWVPLGTTANKQGRVAGRHLVDGRASFPGIVGTAVTKVFDLHVARTGLSVRDCAARKIPVESTTIKHHSRAEYYPGNSEVVVVLNWSPKDGRLLGGVVVGREGVAKRVDVLAAALHAGWTVYDLQALDASYAPPVSPVWDPLLVAANVAAKQATKRTGPPAGAAPKSPRTGPPEPPPAPSRG
ncbi:MAG: FAD-dependent oxidoreductase [Promethearchaeota archaeon]